MANAMPFDEGHEPVAEERMRRIAAPLATKADKIRALGAAGYTRSQIAAFLNIRYQHVRNVLVQEAARRSPSASQAVEAPSTHPTDMGRAQLDETGRLALPPDLLARLNLRRGGVVSWRLEGDELVLMSPNAAYRLAREFLGEEPPSGSGSWTDDFIAQRRAEWGEDDKADSDG